MNTPYLLTILSVWNVDLHTYDMKLILTHTSTNGNVALTHTGLEGHICPSLVKGLEGHICPSVVTSWWRHCDVN